MPSTATTRTVTGLTNGTAYTFRAAAVNGIGTGAYSTASAAVTPVAGDAYWSDTVLLLRGDGNLTDSSTYGRTVTAYGSAAANGEAKFGSAALSFSGSSSDYMTLPESTDFDFGTGGFTLETWLRLTSYPAAQTGGFFGSTIATRFAYTGSSFAGWQWRLDGTSSSFTSMLFETGAGNIVSASWSPSLNQWYHVAVCRASGSIRLFVDGTQIGSTASNSDNITQATPQPVWIGRLNHTGGWFFTLAGQLDDLRITKASRYTANFTPPTAALPTA